MARNSWYKKPTMVYSKKYYKLYAFIHGSTGRKSWLSSAGHFFENVGIAKVFTTREVVEQMKYSTVQLHKHEVDENGNELPEKQIKPTIQNLKKLATQVGAHVELETDHPTDRAVTVVAPDGKQWVDGQCIHMTENYWTYIKAGDGSKEDAIQRAMQRVRSGLEDIDETVNP